MRNLLLRAIFILFILCSLRVNAQNINKQTTSCNPLNLNYRYQLDEPSRREAADPTVVFFKGRYFLFASKSGGYWYSDDLLNWKFIEKNDIPTEDYAPTVVAIKDTLYFIASNTRQCNIYKTDDPINGKWIAKEKLEKAVWDPALFLDKNNHLYLFYGVMKPIYGVELDLHNKFSFIDKPKVLVNPDLDNNGWEVRGDYNEQLKAGSFIEGAWVTENNGKYYLQYATPGTQNKSYADGIYVSDNPLGPYLLQNHNPFSYKPEGFITGAGHGSTFHDKWGNYWYMGTMTISVKHKFERRLGLFPAFFDKDGTFYAYTAFGDFPHKMPDTKMNGPEDFQLTGMLLSYKKPVEVSSALPEHPKENAADEEIRKYWSATTGDKGEWIMIDLQKPCKVNAVQINYFDEATTLLGRSDSDYYQYLLEYSTDKKTWKTLADKRLNKTEVPHDYIELKSALKARYIRLTNYHVPDGKFALSGLRVFGKGYGKPAQPVSTFTALRDTTDARNVTLSWPRNPNATGYTIRYGTAPDKLYLNYQVLDINTLTIHSLSRLQNYYFTIDSFNENGITKGKVIVQAPVN